MRFENEDYQYYKPVNSIVNITSRSEFHDVPV